MTFTARQPVFDAFPLIIWKCLPAGHRLQIGCTFWQSNRIESSINDAPWERDQRHVVHMRRRFI
jgi:hypothetical protein